NSKSGGFYPETGEFKPFEKFTYMHEMLDAVAAAMEGGALYKNKWVSQVFGSTEVFDEFLNALASYEECFRLADRWYKALFRIVDVIDEEGYVTGAELAEGLQEQARETGQI